MFAAVFIVSLIYSANNRSSIKSYIFQINNASTQRIGALQDINDISAVDLRNKLIKKYVSEYFKVIPGERDVQNRPILRSLSTQAAYNQWQNGEAETIAKMSEKNMFRRVRITDADIATMNMPSGHNYKDAVQAEQIFYSIHYYTETWTESNNMATEPIYESGVLYIEARFKPGIDENLNVKSYLESGRDPVGLFMFQVTNIGDKLNK
jgi:hypothetical protein